MNKGSQWKSLLSTLLERGMLESAVCLCELAPGADENGVSKFEYGFWAYDSEGVQVAYCAEVKKPPVLWRVSESPRYTGYLMPWGDKYSLSDGSPPGPRS